MKTPNSVSQKIRGGGGGPVANFYTMITKLVSFLKMFYLMKKLNELLFIRFFSLWGLK